MICENFLLYNETARNIYDKVKGLPIIDYHCHLIPQEIAENKRFKNITELWLGGDHYKWRLMRANGVDEKYITGDGDDFEKFKHWAATIEEAIGNPLYHWTNLELKRYFNYDKALNSKNAEEVWEHCNKIIQSNNFDVKNIFAKFNVESLCTTDDPVDDLRYHKQIASDSDFKTKVYPTFRPSNAFNIELNSFNAYVQELSDSSELKINNYDDIIASLYKRIDFFNQNSCRLSDHSMDPLVFEDYSQDELNGIVEIKLKGQELSIKEINQYKTALFQDLGKKYYDLGWSVQIHMSCIRNTNTAMLETLGQNTGYDAISDSPYGIMLTKTLDGLNTAGKLPKTILYSLNPKDNDMLASIIGCFQGGGIKGKIQLGSAWWFNDHLKGMEDQMIDLASNGLLARFVGMLTDSRSFLSYPRHEYFRRILANLLGRLVETGQFDNDIELVTRIAENICYYNAKEYFGF